MNSKNNMISEDSNNCILTILISTYNRKQLLEENISNLLACGDKRYKIVVSDNCSLDGSSEYISNLNSPDVLAICNKKNYGPLNFLLLVKYVDTPFFMFLNDRDTIIHEGLKDLLDFLSDNRNYDIISSINGSFFLKPGEKESTRFYKYYHLANHPGTMVFRTEFWNKHVDQNYVDKMIFTNNPYKLNCYTSYNLLMNINMGFYRKYNYIYQKPNRDETIPQVRKEIYGGCAYILPQHQIEYFRSSMQMIDVNVFSKRQNSYILSFFVNGIEKVEHEYYGSTKSKWFCIRNKCEGSKPSKWLTNGFIYTSEILKNETVIRLKLKNRIRILFVSYSLLNVFRNILTQIRLIVRK